LAVPTCIAWGEYQQFSFAGAKGETVYGYVVKPPNAAAGKKVPVAMLIHGGPQGSMGDHFHYRWNPQLYAARGFGTVFIDFHGSTGYGQAFTDAISGDWGGAPFEDLMKGLDAALLKFPWLDGNRAAALGASYGGFMVNWINGHTDRFKALVTHAGNLDEKMAYFNTEELWFPEWERGGVPWERPDALSINGKPQRSLSTAPSTSASSKPKAWGHLPLCNAAASQVASSISPTRITGFSSRKMPSAGIKKSLLGLKSLPSRTKSMSKSLQQVSRCLAIVLVAVFGCGTRAKT
jgi:pimeloyl-ACP methyl ester carboxylesterase